jgi:hypothetical protein
MHTNSVINVVHKSTVKNVATVRLFGVVREKFKFPKKKINKQVKTNNADFFYEIFLLTLEIFRM